MQLENQKRSTIQGFIQYVFARIFSWNPSKNEWEIKLDRLNNADKKIGVVKKEKVFNQSDNPALKNTFLFKLNGIMSVEDAAKVYSSLPEVEYAEPNFISTIQSSNQIPAKIFIDNKDWYLLCYIHESLFVRDLC